MHENWQDTEQELYKDACQVFCFHLGHIYIYISMADLEGEIRGFKPPPPWALILKKIFPQNKNCNYVVLLEACV